MAVTTRVAEENIIVKGLAGAIELISEVPAQSEGFALVCHPHPLFGGANTNKVVQTIARTLVSLGYISWRPNFRGVGKSEGVHAQGQGEIEDMLYLLEMAKARYGDLPIVLAGFSFGAYVQTWVAKHLLELGKPAKRLILVGTATGHIEGERHYDTTTVANDTIVIHGSADETVPLANVFVWAEAMELPITVIPGADHFFHRRLHLIRRIIENAW